MLKRPAKTATTEDLGKRVFSELQSALLSFEAGAFAGDVEAIHDMRVSARRLRVALTNFAACLSLETRRQLKDHLTQLADALGRVRDIDVMLESLRAIEAAEPIARRSIITDLCVRHVRRRKYHQQRLVQYFKSEAFRGLKEALPGLTNGQTL